MNKDELREQLEHELYDFRLTAKLPDTESFEWLKRKLIESQLVTITLNNELPKVREKFHRAHEHSIYWFKRYNSLVDKLSDQILEFGDNPKDCLGIIGETIQCYWLHDNKEDKQPIQEINNDIPTNKP